jgi:hypothetical protein
MLVTADNGRVDGAIGASAIDLVASIPLTKRVFLDARLPLGLVSGAALIGNAMFGARWYASSGRSTWFTIGGSMGLPLLSRRIEEELGVASYPNAFWNLHQYYGGIVPIKADIAFETHASFFGFRGQIEPVAYVAYHDRVDSQFALQHAVEFQFGHEYYAGLRFQGMLIPTLDDKYQFAMEPFLGIEKRIAFARLGLMMPLDEVLGPPAREFLGVRIATGVRFE